LEIVVSSQGAEPHVVALGWRPIVIGRSPHGDLVLSDSDVSWTHATLWIDQGSAWIRDLGSSNGTFVNDRRLASGEALKVADGDVVRLGAKVTIAMVGEIEAAMPRERWLVESSATTVAIPVVGPRFRIGADAFADLRLPDGPPFAATLVLRESGEVWLEVDEEPPQVITDGDVFQVSGHALKLMASGKDRANTLIPDHWLHPYVLTVDARKPSARLEQLHTGLAYVVDSGHRAVLLYLLGARYHRDRSDGRAEAECGWCDDHEVQTGIWGRNHDANKYHVLLYRLRADLRMHGFDPWFIEKRSGAIRARVADVHVVAAAEGPSVASRG
jgi:hypothetical protein